MVKLVNKSQLFAMDQEFMKLFYSNKQTDCILYSGDGNQFKIHREILSQTELMQNILTSAKESCCQPLEIICPCSKIELSYVVKFLYQGQLHCDSSFDMSNILKILAKVFGFPEKFLGEWQEEFVITENAFDKPNSENDGFETKSLQAQIPPQEKASPKILPEENPSHQNDIANTEIFDVDFNVDIKNEVDLDSIEKGLSNPIIIPLKPKKFKSDDGKKMSQSVKQFKCEICDAGFMKKINLKRHIKVHEKTKPYNCGTYATFTSKKIMKNHKATVHEGQKQNIHFDFEENVEIYDFSQTEEIMGNSASTKNWSENTAPAVNLVEQNSKKSITNPRRRSCPYCDQTFSNGGNLNRHVQTAHESKKYPCTECSKQFATNLNLKCHFNYQHAEDPKIYHCDFCHKEWTHYFMFKKHKNCALKPDKDLNKKSKKKNSWRRSTK